MPTAEVAADILFGPLGITRWQWPTDPQGRSWGCDELQLAGRDLLKLGLLYLDGGRWEGGQLIDEAYVATATSGLLPGGPPEFCGYGLLWWVADRADPPLFFAGGYGGQYVVVVPDLDLVVVTMADAEALAQPKGSQLRRLVMETVLPAFR